MWDQKTENKARQDKQGYQNKQTEKIMLKKPQSVEMSPFKSAKWDEITEGRNFQPSDAPIIALLCQWYEVVDQCMSDIDYGGGIQVAYQNDIGDIKALPQISTMKQASAEIRALNKQLGIDDEAKPEPKEQRRSPLIDVMLNRQTRAQNSNTVKAG